MLPNSIAPVKVPRESIAPSVRSKLIALAGVIAALFACYATPLIALAHLISSSELYSYVPLVPVITLYLIWLQRHLWQLRSRPDRRLSLAPLLVGFVLVAAYWLGRWSGWTPAPEDYLALMVSSLISFLIAACGYFLGGPTFRAIAFPLGFLIFCVPWPTFLHDAIVGFLQAGSAAVAEGFFVASMTPVWRQDLILHLPGISLQVAPECSGLHSTLILLITALLGSYLFLRGFWRRFVLVAAVLPLALLRNGFRIFTVGQLCVHIGPQMIDSYVHRKGGPIFFALSLIPFYFLLKYLHRSERVPAR